MKATGIIRKVDELGRIVIPKELRKSMDIREGDPIEIFIDGENIILKKYTPFCVFCSSSQSIVNFGGKNICSECAKKIGTLTK
ncbi:MAG: AbrB/MazE/SpoVT family DNA-binding domain-containing protein [Clostridia bacterium]|nr:AbrB/MazE/SpoVT family DNA-binding domain-containing protein [Clostridia bacterium]